MTERKRDTSAAVHQALDEVRFGPANILNLRAAQPGVNEAERRTESWLRERQVARVEEVLVITGRGNASIDGVSVVREAVARLFIRLRRGGVVARWGEHTPGSFVVELAPFLALRDAPRRRGRTPPLLAPDPGSLAGLELATRALLRELALKSLEQLGVHGSAALIEREMLQQFALVAAGVPEGPDREARLRAAIGRAIREHEDTG